MTTLVVVGAHALDAELMGGEAALCMKRRGWETYMVHMTRGERGNPRKSPEAYGEQLEGEMARCAQMLESGCRWMGYVAGSLPEEAVMVEDLCRLFRQLDADTVLTHWKGSYHPRHRLTHDVVAQAVLKMPDSGYLSEVPPRKAANLLYGENMEDQEGFVPELYLDTSEIHEQWERALHSYELYDDDGVNKYPYQAFYGANAKLRGIEVGVSLAKALMLQPSLATELKWPDLTARLPIF